MSKGNNLKSSKLPIAKMRQYQQSTQNESRATNHWRGKESVDGLLGVQNRLNEQEQLANALAYEKDFKEFQIGIRNQLHQNVLMVSELCKVELYVIKISRAYTALYVKSLAYTSASELCDEDKLQHLQNEKEQQQLNKSQIFKKALHAIVLSLRNQLNENIVVLGKLLVKINRAFKEIKLKKHRNITSLKLQFPYLHAKQKQERQNDGYKESNTILTNMRKELHEILVSVLGHMVKLKRQLNVNNKLDIEYHIDCKDYEHPLQEVVLEIKRGEKTQNLDSKLGVSRKDQDRQEEWETQLGHALASETDPRAVTLIIRYKLIQSIEMVLEHLLKLKNVITELNVKSQLTSTDGMDDVQQVQCGQKQEQEQLLEVEEQNQTAWEEDFEIVLLEIHNQLHHSNALVLEQMLDLKRAMDQLYTWDQSNGACTEGKQKQVKKPAEAIAFQCKNNCEKIRQNFRSKLHTTILTVLNHTEIVKSACRVLGLNHHFPSISKMCLEDEEKDQYPHQEQTEEQDDKINFLNTLSGYEGIEAIKQTIRIQLDQHNELMTKLRGMGLQLRRLLQITYQKQEESLICESHKSL